MTISWQPDFNVRLSHWCGEPAGKPVYVMSGLIPMSSIASGRSKPCDGAPQDPRNDAAVCFPPLSIVFGSKRILEPTASKKAACIGIDVGNDPAAMIPA